jgi:hypothetical protein
VGLLEFKYTDSFPNGQGQGCYHGARAATAVGVCQTSASTVECRAGLIALRDIAGERPSSVRQRYFVRIPSREGSLSAPGPLDYDVNPDADQAEPESDIYAFAVDRVVSVSPISLDLSSRVELKQVAQALHGDMADRTLSPSVVRE